jgi:hypothetical protein
LPSAVRCSVRSATQISFGASALNWRVAATADDDLVSAVAQVAQVGVYDHEWTRTSGGP